jgi:hypothetical protein
MKVRPAQFFPSNVFGVLRLGQEGAGWHPLCCTTFGLVGKLTSKADHEPAVSPRIDSRPKGMWE